MKEVIRRVARAPGKKSQECRKETKQEFPHGQDANRATESSARYSDAISMTQLEKRMAAAVEQELLVFLDSKSDELKALDQAGAALLAEVRRLVDAGGSRVRPVLCVTAYEGFRGVPPQWILQVAASFELLHTFALIHDDLADRGLVRRGEATTSAEHSANTALLAGDMAFSLSDELYFGSAADPADLVRAFRHVAEARLQALTGQFLELTSVPTADAQLSNKIARLKTASYSLVAPLLVGADLAGASEQALASLRAFGELVGVAYQMRDDLKLLSGTADKDVHSDLLNGRPTALISTALRMAGGAERERMMQIWGNPRSTAAQLETFMQIARQMGTEARIKQDISSLASRAKDALHNCPPGEMNETGLHVLNNLADRICS